MNSHCPKTPLYLVVLLTLIFGFGCSGEKHLQKSRQDDARGTMFYRDALLDLEYGRFTSAMIKLDSALTYRPGYANAYRVKGWVLENMNQIDSAIVAYETCLSIQSNHPQVQADLGRLYLQTNQFEKAAFNLKKATQAFPDSGLLQLRLAEAYYYQDLLPLANDFLRSYQRTSTEPHSDYWKFRGLISARQGQAEEAETALSRLVELKPEDPVAWKQLGIARFQNENFDNAMNALNQAAVLAPDDPEVYLYRARYFYVFEKREIAWEQINLAVNLDSSNTEVLFQIGKWYYDEESYTLSQNHFNRLVSTNPQYWEAYKWLGLLAEKSDQKDQALAHYNTYLKNTFHQDDEVMEKTAALEKSLKPEE